jgi:hypothetical protein
MSLFGLFMMAATSGQPLTNLTLVAPAFADGDAPEFTCPEGVITCYKAFTEGEDTDSDGEYTDINNLPATAAGSGGEDDNGESLHSVVKPRHFRSF